MSNISFKSLALDGILDFLDDKYRKEIKGILYEAADNKTVKLLNPVLQSFIKKNKLEKEDESPWTGDNKFYDGFLSESRGNEFKNSLSKNWTDEKIQLLWVAFKGKLKGFTPKATAHFYCLIITMGNAENGDFLVCKVITPIEKGFDYFKKEVSKVLGKINLKNMTKPVISIEDGEEEEDAEEDSSPSVALNKETIEVYKNALKQASVLGVDVSYNKLNVFGTYEDEDGIYLDIYCEDGQIVIHKDSADKFVEATFLIDNISEKTINGKLIGKLVDITKKLDKSAKFKVNGYNVVKACSKYLYKGQIVTASSKEEAIKVLAEKKETKGKTSYSTVNIGGKQWMSENLAYDDGGKGITYNPKNKEYYYTWDAAKRVAKKLGWKLPSVEDWNKAAEKCGDICTNPEEDDIGYRDYEGGNLKEKLKVNLAGGYSVSFNNVGSNASFWTSSKYSGTDAYYKYFSTSDSMASDNCNKNYQYSVRLVK